MSFESFRHAFKGDIVLPSDPDYATAITRWAVNCQKNAKIVAFVKDAADVAAALHYARAEGLEIAVKGGGHNLSGASSTDGGLVIDLSRYLSTVKIDTEQKLAYVGGGALWDAVDKAAIEHGLATVGGTINHTGVGGLTLGGGYGVLTGAYGLAIDNLVQATLIIADGSILTVNKAQNVDLFWAIRGSGSNFGVCTEFVLQLHPQRRTVFAGITIFPPPMIGSVISVVEDWWNNDPSSKEAVVIAMTRGQDGNPFVGVMVFYNGSEEDGRATFKKLFDLQPIQDMCCEMPYENVNELNNSMLPHGFRHYGKSVFFKQSQKQVAPKLFEHLVSVSANTPVQFAIFQQYFPGKKVAAVPTDQTAYFHRGSTCHCECMVTWSDPNQDLEAVRQTVKGLLKHVSDSENASYDLGYPNYSGDVTSTSAIEALFGHNYKRLRELKGKYDPDQVFKKWYAIAPAV